MGAKRRIRKTIAAGIRAKVGVDPKLERAADKILKTDRVQRKGLQKKLRYHQNTSEKRMVAKYAPTETMKSVRTERSVKKLHGEMADVALPAFRPLRKNMTSMVSRNTQAGIDARKLAKEKGHEAAVSIAKARKAKIKKLPITQSAIALNASAERSRRLANGISNRAARVAQRQGSAAEFKRLTGMKKRSGRVATVAHALENRGHLPEAVALRKKATLQKGLSKDQARISGGYATSIKRNAESGISKIAQGKQYKAVARLGGALSIAAMFASHLMGKEKRRG